MPEPSKILPVIDIKLLSPENILAALDNAVQPLKIAPEISLT